MPNRYDLRMTRSGFVLFPRAFELSMRATRAADTDLVAVIAHPNR